MEGPVTIDVASGVDNTVTVTAKINGEASDFAAVTFIDREHPEQGYVITLMNTAGVELPSTGGPGTYLFYLLGGLLVLIAGSGLLLHRRRGHHSAMG